MASSASAGQLYSDSFDDARKRFSRTPDFSAAFSRAGTEGFDNASKANALTYAAGTEKTPLAAAQTAWGLAQERTATNQAMMQAFAQLNQPRQQSGGGDDWLGSAFGLAGTIAGTAFGGPIGGAVAGALGGAAKKAFSYSGPNYSSVFG